MATNILLQEGKARKRLEAVPERQVALAMLVLDLLLLLLIALIAGMASSGSGPLAFLLAIAGLAVFPAWKWLMGLYPGHGLARAQRMERAMLAAGAGLLTNIAVTDLLSGPSTQLELGTAFWYLGAGGCLIAFNDAVSRRLLARLGRWQQPIFIFGAGEAASDVIRQLALYPHLGLRAVCVVDENSIYIEEELHGIPIIRFRELGNHSRLLTITKTALVVEQFVERSFILRLYTTGIFKKVLLIPSCHDMISLHSRIRRVGSVMAIEAGSERPSALSTACKRAFDVVASGLALVALAPLMGILALAVKRDSKGPAYFSQSRWAGGDREFTAWKFRTMHVDGDRRLRRYFLNNPEAEQQYARYRKLDDDPRVTRLGRFLRKTSLDELPQLWNVFRGDMSLIGPRPYTMDEISRLGPAAEILGLVRPGVSGFWQVSGRNQRTFRERIEMDCYYVRNYSGWLDLWILYRTVIAVITGQGK